MDKPVTGYFTPEKSALVARLLDGGGIAVLPTDTIYGFHCVSGNIEAVGRISRIKGTVSRKGFILLADGIDMVDSLVSKWPDTARSKLERLWPSPLTALLPANDRLPGELVFRDKLAVRVPKAPYLRKIVSILGRPLVSTSVNIAGESPERNIDAIIKKFPGADAYISRRGRSVNEPSTLVDFTSFPPEVIRRGCFPAGRI